MSYLVTPKGTDLDDRWGHHAVASTIEEAVEIFEDEFGDDTDKYDVYFVSDKPIATAKRKSEELKIKIND